MGEKQTNLPFILTLAAMVIYGTTVKTVELDASSNVVIDVSQAVEINSPISCLLVKCTFYYNGNDLDNVISLSLYGSSPYGNMKTFDKLAFVEEKNSIGRRNGMNQAEGDVSSTGKLNSREPHESALVLSWNKATNFCPNAFKCVAEGIKNKKSLSISSKIAEAVSGGGACCWNRDSVNSVLSRSAATMIFREVRALSKNLLNLQDKIEDVHFLSTISRAQFDVSGEYEGRIYLASRWTMQSNIAQKNKFCTANGGYLVEFDNQKEFNFVLNFAKAIDEDENFMSGGNDLDKEGVFTYFHSKKAIPSLKWRSGQPDNYRNEDCVIFRLDSYGLNDVRCEASARFICEIPLHAK
ncbi:hypothetical protein RRG08_035515 [Elysia crispata]|uniref:C-type lectin domain-containing protein n=1 Tax=Elysia crispata TaxID=231223 RepID=A0AAE0ZBR9_9GAST|nr:hypothetical protein RRG08_035515 [Elysia crispata]